MKHLHSTYWNLLFTEPSVLAPSKSTFRGCLARHNSVSSRLTGCADPTLSEQGSEEMVFLQDPGPPSGLPIMESYYFVPARKICTEKKTSNSGPKCRRKFSKTFSMASLASAETLNFGTGARRRRARMLKWDQNRNLILHFYEIENRPLREVRQIMQQFHNFDAT
jgi:Clr5 domain